MTCHQMNPHNISLAITLKDYSLMVMLPVSIEINPDPVGEGIRGLI